MQENIQTGLLTEIACQYEFTRYGFVLFAPITTDSRSDFIADINGKLFRIQCKSALTSSDGRSFSFNVCSINWNTKEKHTYENEIDFFYTFHNGKSYLIPIEDVSNKKTKTLRIEGEDKNNKSITWAEDYEFEKILKKIDSNIKAYVPHQSKEKEYFCVDCGERISSSKAQRCKKCNNIYFSSKKEEKMEEKITRGELKDMIRKETFLSIGKIFGVSDNAIRKWCKKYNLPSTKKEIKNISDEDWINI